MKHTRFDGSSVFLRVAIPLLGGALLTFLAGMKLDGILGLAGVVVGLYLLLHASNQAERADRKYEREQHTDAHDS